MNLKIKQCERNLNNVVNNTTDKTPFEMLHGYSPRFNDGILRILADEEAEAWEDPAKIQSDTRKTIEDKQQKIKRYYDQRKTKTTKFDLGEIVVVRRIPSSTGEPLKTQPKYRGPLVVSEVLPSDTYRVSQLCPKERGHFYSTTAHASQLKGWKCFNEDDTEEEFVPRRSGRTKRAPDRYTDPIEDDS
jgi:hypothetical protein